MLPPPCSPKANAEFVSTASDESFVIPEDAGADDVAAVLEDEDMAPALKEQAFVARLIRQNSIAQR
jgi:hypothetical protein